MPDDMPEALAQELQIGRERVASALDLLAAGLHPVFIAAYRRADTRGMDEDTLIRLRDAHARLTHREAVRQEARTLAEQQGALTDDLQQALQQAQDPEVIEDLVRPIRPKRRTAGQVAKERGLSLLAEYVRHGPPDGPDLLAKAAEFVDPAHEVHSAEEALAGAAHILAERVADAPAVRQAVREFVWKNGSLMSRPAGPQAKRNPEYRTYFDFTEALSRIPPHRVMAINRGQRSKILRVTVTVPFDQLVGHVLAMASGKTHRFADFLRRVVADALGRLILPAVDRQIRRRMTDEAERHAIDVFVANLRSLLMTRPMPNRRVLAIQPGYRTGCKVAVLDVGGALLADTILYPFQPQNKWDEARQAFDALLTEHGIETITIGNGTGCREVEAFVSETLDARDGGGVRYAVVSEAGAAAYADSPGAREEFGHIEPAIRAAVSIGRRLQDPLKELVKVDPRAIGVGLYQHDVDQGPLERALADTLASCVAAVGADVNTASPEMLRHVPGLGPEQVDALVAKRGQVPIATREELANLPTWDDTALLQAAGFLRVHGPNPLDATRIHPERYADAERLLAHLGHAVDHLALPDVAPAIREALTGLSLEPLARELDLPLPRLQHLVGALLSPGKDPRDDHHGPILRERMRTIDDLQPGQWVKGTVRNVVDFGAFVDIGVKEEGLIHISQFSRRYVRNPLRFLHVGDVVNARVVKVDTEKHRISLSLIREKPEKGRPQRRKPGETSDDKKPAEAKRGEADRGRREPGGQPERRGGERRAPSRGGGRGPGDRGRGAGRPGGGRGRGPRRDDRPRRTGPPRIVISESEGPVTERPPDASGRPKIRWAYYDSDSPQEHVGTEYRDEFDEVEEGTLDVQTPQEPPDAESAEAPATEPAEEAAPESAEKAAAEAEAPAQAPSETEQPAEEPPAEAEAPEETPPAEEPPAEAETPEETPPAKEPPAEAEAPEETPPAEEAPAEAESEPVTQAEGPKTAPPPDEADAPDEPPPSEETPAEETPPPDDTTEDEKPPEVL